MTEKHRIKKKIARAADGQALPADGTPIGQVGQIRRSEALIWRQTLWGIGASIAAFVLGRCPLLFGTRPLGIALLCAATHSIPYLYGGLLLSALTAEQGRLVLACTYTAALLIRILSRSAIELPGAERMPRRRRKDTTEAEGEGEAPLAAGEKRSVLSVWRGICARVGELLTRWFSESIYLRMMTSCVSAFIISLYVIISGGFLYYDLFGAFFAMVCAPAATFLYAGLFTAGKPCPPEEAGRKWSPRTVHRLVAVGTLTFSILFSMRDLTLLGISLSAALGFALTLLLARRRGLLPGLVCGVICGLAYSPALTPSFVLGALLFALLGRVSLVIAATVSVLAALGWSFYPLGLDALSGWLPALLCGTLAVCASDKLTAHPMALWEAPPETAAVEEAERSDVDRMRAEQSEQKMRELSETFSTLAGLFYSLSDRLRRPGLLDLRRMCDRAFDGVCTDCPDRDLCWGADYSGTLARLSRMAAALHERGTVTEQDIDDTFLRRCPALPELLNNMNGECARMTEAALRTEKTEVFAMDFDGLSRILADALEEQNADFQYDEELSEQIRRALFALDIRVQGVLVIGRRQRRIVARGVDASATALGTAAIHRRLEEVCGFALGELYFDLTDTGVTMRASTRPRYETRRAVRTMAAEGGVCGDTVNVFDTERDCTYALISDGMGSGQEAAFTSGMCSLFLEKMLTVGNRTETSLRMLNSMIRQRGGGIGMECSATVDLMEFDRLTGKAVFLKSGASPTYVRRDDCLFKLHAKTAPIGILRAVDAQRISYDARPGDVIIMLSDGIGAEESAAADAPEDCIWLLDLLADGWQDDLDTMAEAILTRARDEGSRDDLSVVLMEVVEA